VDERDFWQRMVDWPVTNAWFFRPALFAQVGNFDPTYRYVADREFFIRLGLTGIRPVPVYQVFYHYRRHSGSATISAEDSRMPKRGLQRIAVLTEDLRMLENFLNRRGIPPKARCAVRRSHSERTYRLTVTAFYHRLYRQAIQSARRGLRHNALWPVIFASMAIRRLSKEVSAEP
jgi:hypothetical protein